VTGSVVDPEPDDGRAGSIGRSSPEGGAAIVPPASSDVHHPPEPPSEGGWLHLRVLPEGWMRALVVTVTAVLTVVIALADLASAWVMLALPLTVAVVVAYHEALERLLRPRAHDCDRPLGEERTESRSTSVERDPAGR
jgi:hypothetical protein